MPRQPRLDAPDALHHVMYRSVDGIMVFRNRKDGEDFLKRLYDLCGAGKETSVCRGYDRTTV